MNRANAKAPDSNYLKHRVNKAAVGDRAVRFRVREGGHYGGSLVFRFSDAGLPEPEHLYIRYHLRFGADWEPGRGGKLPGPSKRRHDRRSIPRLHRSP